MIRLQPTAALPGYLLVGSDLPNLEDARSEVTTWAKASGCDLTQPPRRLSVFHGNTVVREWTLVPLPVHCTPPTSAASLLSSEEFYGAKHH